MRIIEQGQDAQGTVPAAGAHDRVDAGVGEQAVEELRPMGIAPRQVGPRSEKPVRNEHLESHRAQDLHSPAEAFRLKRARGCGDADDRARAQPERLERLLSGNPQAAWECGMHPFFLS